MTTGTQSDLLTRLKSVLPPWFGTASAPVLNAVLSGFASGSAAVYSLLAYVRLQTRIGSATDGFLDMIALDFFGRRFQRLANEADAAFRIRILAELLRPRATVASIVKVLSDLTGRTPKVFEPPRPAAGGYGVACGYGLGGTVTPSYAISSAGAYASPDYPAQVFVIAYRPLVTYGVPNVDGYGGYLGGYGVGSIEYVTASSETGIVTDASIYAAVNGVRAAGVTVWVSISN